MFHELRKAPKGVMSFDGWELQMLMACPGEDSVCGIQDCGKARVGFPPAGQGVWTRRAGP